MTPDRQAQPVRSLMTFSTITLLTVASSFWPISRGTLTFRMERPPLFASSRRARRVAAMMVSSCWLRPRRTPPEQSRDGRLAMDTLLGPLVGLLGAPLVGVLGLFTV